jgi:hypothetical protein
VLRQRLKEDRNSGLFRDQAREPTPGDEGGLVSVHRAVKVWGVAECYESARQATSNRWKSAVVTTSFSNSSGQEKGSSAVDARTASLLVWIKAFYETSRGPRSVGATF